MNHIPAQKNKPKTNPIRQACVVCQGVAGLIKPDEGFLRKSAWGRLTAESLGLLITQQITTALRASQQNSLRQSLLGAFTLNPGMVKLLKGL